MIAEGTKVAYVGLQTRGRAIGDEGVVMQTEIDYAHVQWTSGNNQGTVQAVRNGDLVANGSLTHHPLTDSSFEGSVVDLAVESVFARRGSLGLFNALHDDGHLTQLPTFADEAIGHLAARLRQDPSVAEVLARLDDDDAAEFVAVACRVALRDAFEDG